MAELQYLNAGNSEVQDKQALAYRYATTGTVGVAASGVIEGLAVTQTTTASGSVIVGAGACINQGNLSQGCDQLVNTAAKTIDVFTANPVGGLPRNDIVVFDSVTVTTVVLIGTPATVPTDPTTPATATRLARLRHAASATTIPAAKIDDLRVFTSIRGTDDVIEHLSLVRTGPTTTSLADSTLTPIGAGWTPTADNVGTGVIAYSGLGVVSVTKTGLYRVNATLNYGGINGTGSRVITVWKNGVAANLILGAVGGHVSRELANTNRVIRLDAGDTIQLVGYQSSGIAAPVQQIDTFWQVTYVSRV